jgi:hypothetical protein
MATASYSRKLNLTRDQLAQFLTDQQQIRQFELLFAVVDQIAPDVVNEVSLAAGSAQATANEALALIASLAQDTAVDDAAINAKVQTALDSLSEVVKRLQAFELLPAAPVTERNNSIVTDYLDFNGIAPHASRIRRMAWNEIDQTVEIGMEYDVVQQIGLETYARVANFTGLTIPNGTVVGFTGAVPDSALSVAPYLANGSTPSLYIVGVMTHDLPDTGNKGYCTVFGFVRDVNTSAFTLGDVLYASPTIAGAFTNIKPTAPNNVIPVAAVLQIGTTDGVIFVRPTIEQQLYYGEFTKTDSQTPAVINTAYPLTFTNTQIANGVTIGGTTSQIIVAQAGLYNINVSVQITSTSASQKAVRIWLRLNGTTDVPNSARLASLTRNGGYLVATLNQVESLLAGNFIEVMYASDSTAISIATVAATAYAPAAPAAIITITQTEQ